MLKKNDEIKLYIDAFSSEGSGIGRFEGMAVFVDGAAAGDTVLAHIIKVKPNYAVGKLLKVLSPSKDRIAPDCPLTATCGGCAFRHVSYEAEVKMKREKVENAFKRIGGIDRELDGFIEADSLVGYRNKAQYPVGFDRELKIGFYALHTHRIVNCDNCLLQPEVFADIVAVIRKWTVEFGVPVYDGESGKGLLRHIYIRQGTVSKEIMVCLVINGDGIPSEKQLVERLSGFADIKSIALNINKKDSNVILGDVCRTIYGSDYIYDELCGVKIRLSPLSFYQINHTQAEKLYEKACEYADLDGGETVVDMYCGAGTIGLSMSRKAKRIIGIEIVAPAVEDAKFNAELNGIENAGFYCMDAAEAAQMLREKGINPDVIILDPPRKGCAEGLVKTVSEMNPDRIVYVSCDPATLARDCKRFSQFGYNVEKLTAVDLFPRTLHVETVCCLKK